MTKNWHKNHIEEYKSIYIMIIKNNVVNSYHMDLKLRISTFNQIYLLS